MDSSLTAPVQTEQRPSHPFDAVADRYDREFTGQLLGRWLRIAVWREMERAFSPGQTVLELGCGTGADAVWLARRDIRVLATDASEAMLNIAREKAAAAGVDDRVSFAQLDIQRLAAPDWTGDRLLSSISAKAFDGVLSNFGPLNCLSDRRALAPGLARVVRPGGQLVFGVMGPLCPWEFVWFLSHGKVRAATRRFRSGYPATVGGQTIRVWYPSARQLRREMAPTFVHRRTVGVGALLPPSDMGHLVAHAPRLFARVNRLEDRLRARFPWTLLNDHHVTIYQKVG